MAIIIWKTLILPLIFALALAPCSIALGHQNQSQSQSQPSLATTSAIPKYHGGPLLTGPRGINIYLIWYGGFFHKDTASITNFFASFNPSNYSHPYPEPTVSAWWKTFPSYKDKAGNSVSSTVKLVKQVGDAHSLGKNIKRAQIANLIKNKIETNIFPLDSNGIYLVLTAKDVVVERLCMGSCGFHDSILVSAKRLVYAHVGNSLQQCPGLCAWPYANSANGPPGQALVAPNGVDADGMVMNIATVLAGAATNPYKTAYFQGDALAPLEAVTACPGIFGAGAYPGYPGSLLVDKVSKASYNAYGINHSKFLLPATWDIKSLNCKVVG
ncbi:Protein EXORDIUM-like [Quillaja saponaria]|uniref:Protein EXORDIUM-like n=1 Tax=Quillaja saponaria TaxID=32244 RepID=A0AAD7Q179_QUISA|nr:Protein EXORDIUM-like [Quillaja saponaria]